MRLSACALKTKFLAIPLCLLALGLGVLLGHYSAHPSVVVFDARSLRGEFIRQLALHHANSDQVQTSQVAFNKGLTQVLAHYGASHRVIILEKKSVLSGGADITPEIRYELSRWMRVPS